MALGADDLDARLLRGRLHDPGRGPVNGLADDSPVDDLRDHGGVKDQDWQRRGGADRLHLSTPPGGLVEGCVCARGLCIRCRIGNCGAKHLFDLNLLPRANRKPQATRRGLIGLGQQVTRGLDHKRRESRRDRCFGGRHIRLARRRQGSLGGRDQILQVDRENDMKIEIQGAFDRGHLGQPIGRILAAASQGKNLQVTIGNRLGLREQFVPVRHADPFGLGVTPKRHTNRIPPPRFNRLLARHPQGPDESIRIALAAPAVPMVGRQGPDATRWIGVEWQVAADEPRRRRGDHTGADEHAGKPRSDQPSRCRCHAARRRRSVGLFFGDTILR